MAATRADFNFCAKIKTPLWLLCVFHIFTSTSLESVTAVSVLQAQKSGLGNLNFGIQNKSVFEMSLMQCFTSPVCKNDDVPPLSSKVLLVLFETFLHVKPHKGADYEIGLKSEALIVVKWGLSCSLVLDKLNWENMFPKSNSLLLCFSVFTKDTTIFFSFSALISPGNNLCSMF